MSAMKIEKVDGGVRPLRLAAPRGGDWPPGRAAKRLGTFVSGSSRLIRVVRGTVRKRGEASSGTTRLFWFGFTQPDDAVAGFPLPALFKQFDALEALEHVPFGA